LIISVQVFLVGLVFEYGMNLIDLIWCMITKINLSSGMMIDLVLIDEKNLI